MNFFLDHVKGRRSIYALEAKSTVEDAKLEAMIKTAISEAPSPFNSQTSRIVLLLGENNKKLWDIVLMTLESIVAADKFGATKKKIGSFSKSYGTILFFEDTAVVGELKKKFPPYAEHFTSWSLQSSGMAQYVVWAMLASENMGASLQHYNPLIDEKITKEWNLPSSWQLISQMPFGKIAEKADDKDYVPIESRFKVFK